jgi:murein DD-endopeptidase MepM/ murein hydrolase activator NlpD
MTGRAERVLATSFLLFAVCQAWAASDLGVRWQPLRLVNGALFVVNVTAPKSVVSLKGSWLDHEISFAQVGANRWIGIAGVSLATKQGVYPLQLAATRHGGTPIRSTQMIRVHQLARKTVVLTVADKYTAPDPETVKRIEADKEVKAQAFRQVTSEPLWSGAFAPPLDSAITETFGVRRVFNGAVRSEHKGLDFRAAPGTELRASNRGKVLLARDLFFEGNCVVLDHGQGLLTLYMHLSRIAVHEGDMVAGGQILGETGATGRVTGPHLHMSALWQGVAVDPLSLTQLNLPELRPE